MDNQLSFCSQGPQQPYLLCTSKKKKILPAQRHIDGQSYSCQVERKQQPLIGLKAHTILLNVELNFITIKRIVIDLDQTLCGLQKFFFFFLLGFALTQNIMAVSSSQSYRRAEQSLLDSRSCSQFFSQKKKSIQNNQFNRKIIGRESFGKGKKNHWQFRNSCDFYS